MILTNDDYISLAAQCAVGDSGRIDRNGESVYISADIFVDYDIEKDTGGMMPRCAEVEIKDVDWDTVDGSDVDVNIDRLESLIYEYLMMY